MTIDKNPAWRQATSSTGKYQYIDILRGVAILGVIAVHSEQQIKGLFQFTRSLFNYGQLGVQLFFIASAITLCLSMRERHEESNSNFYIRRYFRVAPLYYFGIVFYFMWRAAVSYFNTGYILIDGKYNVVSTFENIFFLHGFDPRNFNFMVPGGSSISTEVFFYLIFPLLFRIQSALSFVGFLKFSIALVLMSLLLQVVFVEIAVPQLMANGVISQAYSNDEFGFLYCSILNQIGIFLIGILTFRKLNSDVSARAVAIAIILCAVSFYMLNFMVIKTGYNGFVYPMLSAIGFSIFAIKLSSIDVFTRLSTMALIKIGRVSFSVYLIHFFVIDVVAFVFRRSIYIPVTHPEVQLLLLFSTVIVLSYGAAVVSFGVLEKPAINWGSKLIRYKDALRRAPPVAMGARASGKIFPQDIVHPARPQRPAGRWRAKHAV